MYLKGPLKISRTDPPRINAVFLLEACDRGTIFYGCFVKGLPFLSIMVCKMKGLDLLDLPV